MRYRIDFIDEARGDVERLHKGRPRALIRNALRRLEQEGPCIGLRMRGAGRRGFCRIKVPERAKNAWRVVYEWPPRKGERQDLIWVWAIREETGDPETDVYRWFDGLLGRKNVVVGPWNAAEPRRNCCDAAGLSEPSAPA